MPKVKSPKEERLVVYCDDLDSVTKEDLIMVSKYAEIRLKPKPTSSLSVKLDSPVPIDAPDELVSLLEELDRNKS